jgi:hypothetical protein
MIQDKSCDEESPVEEFCIIRTKGDRVRGEERDPSLLHALDAAESDSAQWRNRQGITRLDRDWHSGRTGKHLPQLLLCSGRPEIKVQGENDRGDHSKEKDCHHKNGLGNRAHRTKLGDQQQL